MSTQQRPQDSPEAGWSAHQLAAAIRHLAECIREGLLALAKAVRDTREEDR